MMPKDEEMMEVAEGMEDDVSDDSSSGSSSDSEAEDMSTMGVPMLEQRVKQLGGRDYDAHAALVKALRDAQAMPKLEKARQAFSKAFPLPEDLWLEWIEDELRVAMSDEDQDGIGDLYKRAIADYSTVNLWLAYMKHLQDRFSRCEAGTEGKCILEQRTRDVYAASIQAMGLNVAEGQTLFTSMREFERSVLSDMQGQGCDEGVIQVQIERVRSAFQQQLASPGPTVSAAWDEYSSWEKDAKHLEAGKASFEKAQAAYKEREDLEASVRQVTAETVLPTWLDYAAFEEKKGSLPRALCVMERACLSCCLSPLYWHSFLKLQAKAGGDVLAVFARAVRNCPETSSLWCGYMVELEKKGKSSDEIAKLYGRATLCAKKRQDELVQVHIGYCNHVRRCFKKGSVTAQQMRAAFSSAVDLLNVAHPNCLGTRLLRIYWGEVEAFAANDVDHARQIWEQVLKGCKELHIWESIIAAERALRGIGQARALFKRGCNILEGPAQETLARKWVDFERREGDLEAYVQVADRFPDALVGDAAAQAAKIKKDKKDKKKKDAQEDPERAKRREEVMQKWMERKAAQAGSDAPATAISTKAEKPSKRKREDGDAGDGATSGSAHTDKKARGDEHGSIHNVGDDASRHSIFVQNLPPSATEDLVKALFTDCGHVVDARVVKDKFGKAKGFAYIDFKDEKGVDAALKEGQAPRTLEGRKIEASRSRPLKGGSDQKAQGRTLYVNGLTASATKESIMGLFKECGEVDDVRILRHQDGKIKGFCYVQFKDEEGAKKGLVKDKTELDGRVLKVALSDPGRKNAPLPAPAPATRGRGGKSMLALVPRAVKKPQAPAANRPPGKPRAAFQGAPKASAQDSAAGGAAAGSEDGVVKKDNNFFKNLFAKGGDL